jgi:hypothetical protein
MRPMRRVSEFALAKRLPGRIAGAARAPPTRAEVLRNSRRLVVFSDDVFISRNVTLY